MLDPSYIGCEATKLLPPIHSHLFAQTVAVQWSSHPGIKIRKYIIRFIFSENRQTPLYEFYENANSIKN